VWRWRAACGADTHPSETISEPGGHVALQVQYFLDSASGWPITGCLLSSPRPQWIDKIKNSINTTFGTKMEPELWSRGRQEFLLSAKNLGSLGDGHMLGWPPCEAAHN
jgi:hypothetical protein